MATEYKGLTIKFGADTKAMNSALREAKSTARGTATELSLLNKGLKLDPSNVTLLAQKQEVLTRKIQATKQELQAYKTLEADANSGKVNLSSSQWTKLQSDITISTQKLKAYEDELTQIQIKQASANSTLGQAGAKFTELGEKTDGISQKLNNVGSTLTRTVTLGLAAAGTASVAAATKIDTSLTNVKKTVDGTAEDYQKLKDAAIEFSKTNAVSASQILDVESLGAQLGYTLDVMSNGKSEVQEFGEVVSGLDIATNMDAETAGSELAQFFNIMQLGKEETKNYASAIVDLGNKNATTESNISSMALRIAGAGKQLNMTGADVLGLATAMSSLGIEAEMGGTAISTIMSSIDKSVALSDDNLKTWADTCGMTTDQFKASWENNVAETLTNVLKNMQGAVDEGGNMSVMLDELGISSLRQTDVMKRLAGSGDVLSNAISTANTAWEENIALDNEVENRNNSLSAKFEMLKNRAIAVAEQIGRPLADALLDACDACEPLFSAVENGAKTFSELTTEEQRTILGFAGMVTALGPVLKIMGNTSNAFKSVGSMMTKVSQGMASLNIEALKQAGTWNSTTTAVQKATVAQKAQTVATQAGTVATKAFGVAMKATLAGLAVAVIVKLCEAISKLAQDQQKATERANNLKNAQDNLLSSTEAVKTSSEQAGESVETQSKSFQTLRDEIDETIQKQSDFANSQKDTWGQLNASSEYVAQLVDEISTLSNKESLTADEQAKLSAKVQEYNNITGDTVSVVDATNGKLSVSTDELKKNSEQWKRNAEAQALQERYKTAYQNKLEALDKYNQALESQKQVEETLAQLEQTHSEGKAELIRANTEELKKRTEATDQAKQVLDDYDAVLNDSAIKQAELTKQTFYSTDTFRQLSEQLGMSTTDLQALCEQYGITGEDSTKKFVEGMQSGYETLISAGATISGLTLDEFKNKVDEYRIEGEADTRAFAEGIAGGYEEALVAGSNVADVSISQFKQKLDKYKITGSEDITAFANAMKNGQGDVMATASQTAGMGLSQFTQLCSQYGISGTDDINAFASAIRNNGGNAESAASDVANKSKNSLDVDTSGAGNSFSDGFARGISSFAQGAIDAAINLGNWALNALSGAIKQGSPSKLTRKSGEWFTIGFAEGIEDKQKEAIKASQNLAKTTMKALETSMSSKAVQLGAVNMTVNQKQSTEDLTNWLDAHLGSIIEDSTPQENRAGGKKGVNVNLNYSASDNAKTMFNDLVTRLETLDIVKG